MASNNSYTILDEEQSRNIIVEYIQTHPGCIAEDILRGQKMVGRKKLFSILHYLKKKKIIIEDRRKSTRKTRNKKLLVSRGNPHVLVLNELNRIQKVYISILNKTVEAYNNGRYLADWKAKTKDLEIDYGRIISAELLLLWPLNIYVEFFKLYMMRLVASWSNEIKDREVLYDVNNTVVAKFIDMQIRTYKILATASHNAGSADRLSSYLKLLTSPEQLTDSVQHLENYGMESEVKEFSHIINSIFLDDELNSYFRRRGNLYRWDRRYKVNDLKELAEDIAQHPDYMEDGYRSMYSKGDPPTYY
jgi:hypothetical protein